MSESFYYLEDKVDMYTLLIHYDVNLPLRLACDASAYGVGAVILHVMANKDEKPIVYVSHSSMKSEKNHSQIEQVDIIISKNQALQI